MEQAVLQQLLSICAIAGAIAAGTVSPGPSFILVARTSVSFSRSAGLAAALGMGVGGATFATAALVGLNSIFTAVPKVYMAFKIAGGLYLVILGLRIWLNSSKPIDSTVTSDKKNSKNAFLLGLGTQLSNPKAAVVYASVFAALLPKVYSLTLAIILVAVIFVIETGWYSIVAVSLSSQKARGAYLRSKKWIDRFAGGCVTALGVKLLLSFRQ
ncbi:MAG: LysE family translocator [Fibrobacter sp.]|nr:LysE family translocator [Fibrobacter sp.]